VVVDKAGAGLQLLPVFLALPILVVAGVVEIPTGPLMPEEVDRA
jgi:hypothetical protein